MDEFTEICTEKLAENSIKYLYNISNESSLPTILKSVYSTKYRLFEELHKQQLVSIKTNRKSRCSRCCIKFSEGPTSYRVKPETKKNKFTKKLLKKSETKKTLTKYQKKYLKKIQQGNQLSITCGICKKERNILLDKSKKNKVTVKTNLSAVPSKVKKKRKRKDKFCGLKESAVINSLSVNNNNNTKLPLIQNNNITNSKKDGKFKKSEPPIEVIDLTDNVCGSYIGNGVKNNSKNRKKKKNKKKRQKQLTEANQKPSNSVVNITLNNKIAKRKETKVKHQNMEKLKSIINSASKSKKVANKLNEFLKSF